MEKRISFFEFQSVKSVAKAIDPHVRQRNKLEAQIKKLVEEFKVEENKIKMLEAGIVNTLGFRVEQLVKKVIEPGVDGKGQPIKTTKYLPTDIVSYDEQAKQYVITIAEEEQAPAPQGEEETVF